MRFYRFLLLLCPTAFREEYGRELEGVHRRRVAQASGLGRVWVWLDAISDLALTGVAAHWDLLVKDTAYAVRTSIQSPGFSLAVIGVASLGIAAATSVFSIADHVPLRALPFPDADRLVKLWQDETPKGYPRMDVSPANYRDWKAASKSFEAMAAHRALSVNMSGTGEPERLEGAAVSAGLFKILGVAPLLGRTMTDDEDTPGAAGTVVLGYGFWQRRFGSDPSILGKKLLFDGQPHMVIGVMPKDFQYPRREVQLWTAMQFDKDDFADRGNCFLAVIARLNKEVSLVQARAELKSVAVNLERLYPKENAQSGVSALLLRDELSSRSRMLVQVLVAAALFVLSIAVTNLANLFLARTAARRNEIAVRLALGASRARLVRQLLTESLLLASAGGLLGTAMAIMAVPLLARIVPSNLPIASVPGVDWRLLVFAVSSTVLTAVAFGILPALRATSGGLNLRAATGTRKDTVRRALVVAQVAASIALVVSTGLLARALLQVGSANPGFATENRLIFRTSLPMPKYLATAPRERFYATVLEELRALPGVTAAAAVSFRPMGDFRGGIWSILVGDVKTDTGAVARFVTPGYFTAMNIPILRGRDVNDSDGPRSLRVAVVSESFVQRLWPGESGIGKSFGVPYGGMQLTIIGVAADIRFRGMEQKSEPQMYFAHAQCPDAAFVWFAPKDFVVASTGDAMTLMPAVRRAVAKADPLQPISDAQTISELIEGETASRRTQLWVIGAFAIAAFLLAACGIHALLSFAVSQRVPEIGLRRALGAQTSDIAKLVLGEGAALCFVGSIIGVAIAYALGKNMEAFLAGVAPTDGTTLLSAICLAFAMTGIGTLIPTARALLVDPAQALRAE